MNLSKLSLLTAMLLFGLFGNAEADTVYALGSSTAGAGTIPGLYTIDTDTGSSTLIGDTGVAGIQGLAISPINGKFYATGGSVNGPSLGLYEIDPTTGSASSIGGTEKFIALDFSPTGILYAQASPDYYHSEDLFTINLATGAPTFVGELDHTHVQGIAFSNDGSEIFWANDGDDLSSLDPVDATETFIGTADDYIQRIAMASDGTLYAAEWREYGQDLYTVNTGTAATTLVADTGIYVYGLAFNKSGLTIQTTSTAPVPTMAVWALMLLTMLLGLIVFTNRRRLF